MFVDGEMGYWIAWASGLVGGLLWRPAYQAGGRFYDWLFHRHDPPPERPAAFALGCRAGHRWCGPMLEALSACPWRDAPSALPCGYPTFVVDRLVNNRAWRAFDSIDPDYHPAMPLLREEDTQSPIRVTVLNANARRREGRAHGQESEHC